MRLHGACQASVSKVCSETTCVILQRMRPALVHVGIFEGVLPIYEGATQLNFFNVINREPKIYETFPN